jgi:hypothetical protein
MRSRVVSMLVSVRLIDIGLAVCQLEATVIFVR